MKRLAAFLAILAILAAAGAVYLLNVGKPNDTPFEVGKWLLQLATALAVAGAVSAVVQEVENLRSQRAEWADLLHDVIQANATVLVARLLLAAHATAKTYSEQIKELIRVGATLRRIAAHPEVYKDSELRDSINQMIQYLIELFREYEERYLPVARQQRVDEERLKLLAQKAAKTPALEELPRRKPVVGLIGRALALVGRSSNGQLLPSSLATADELTAEERSAELYKPMRAGRMLKNDELFPHLAAFRNDARFDHSDFRVGYKTAKRLLEKHAGIRRKRQEEAEDLRGEDLKAVEAE
jgi:hypothetical protein